MKNRKIHTPDGVNDILQQECAIKRNIEQKIADVYKSYGYFEVQAPSFEFIDVFFGSDAKELIKFIDPKGRVLALRPDITTAIARIAATKLSHTKFPKRIFYIGNAFSDHHAYQGVLQNEFTQAGIELLGTTSMAADAEVIAATIEALLQAGLKDFQIELGHAEYFKGLMALTGLEDSVIEDLRELVDRKSLVGIAEVANEYKLDPQLKETILNLPNQFGGIEVISSQKGVGQRAQKALDEIAEVYEILKDYGFEKFVSIDLGMVQKINYYTGIIVKGFARGMGFPICGGGRYDNLIGAFGENIPATGVAIGVDRLMAAIGEVDCKVNADTIVCFEKGERHLALKLCSGLRKNGVITQLWVDDNKDAFAYAKDYGIGGLLIVKGEEHIEIHNIEDHTITKTSVSELLGGYEA